jgi:hypothetical protein
MTFIDPWEKAAECERSVQASVDPRKRTILANIRDRWIALGNESSRMSETDRAESAESINRLHIELSNQH